jgi:hypothetical protein
VAASKLARASAENHSSEFFGGKGGVEEAARQNATAEPNESNPTRRSDIFVAIQAGGFAQDAELFAASRSERVAGVQDPDDRSEAQLAFAVHLHDPVHGLAFSAVSQPLPQQWISWLDNLAGVPDAPSTYMPDAIREIVDAGGLDPREWVAEWVEESLALAVGTVAQRYVARRMGVGEGGFGKGKAKEGAVDAGAGEVARAM